jgi:hypothetical protein
VPNLDDVHDYVHVVHEGVSMSQFWLVLALGMGFEAIVIGLLGAVAARPALDLLVGDLPGAATIRRTSARPIAAAILSIAIGAVAFLTFLLGGLPWIFWFMLTGLALPTLLSDTFRRPGAAAQRIGVVRAFGRGFGLSRRLGMRAGRIRIMGYLIWWIIRVVVAYGGTAALIQAVNLNSHGASAAVGYLLWTAINALAYATIGCLDAAVHLETRMRVEGLDIVLSRALRRRLPVDAALAVPR